jgi:hypothetical protein
MSIPIYQIGDLVTLKPKCWAFMPNYKDSVGLITGLGFHSSQDEKIKSFIVQFESLKHIFGNGRIVWLDEIDKHYPVVK